MLALGNLNKNVLAIGPHPDDLEISCFGTLARLKKEGYEITLLIISKGSKKEGSRTEWAKKAASLIGADVIIEDFEDGNISDNYKLVDLIRTYISKVNPGIIFGPPFKDGHQDHRNVSSAIIAATKNAENIYFYETPKSFGFSPNLYVDITDFIDIKLKAISYHTSNNLVSEGIISAAKYHGFKIGKFGKLFEAFETFRSIC